MKLADYLKANEMTQEAFADAIETSRATVNRYCNGSSFPGPRTMQRIAAKTGGEVTAIDFFPPEANQVSSKNPPQTEAAE